MHEYGLMEGVVARVLEEAGVRRATGVPRVHVEVGELAFASRPALEAAFVSLSMGTILEGAELVLSETRGRVRCDACGLSGGADVIDGSDPHDLLLPLCHVCGSPLIVLEGRGLTLKELTLTVPEASDGAEAREARSRS